MLRGDAEALLFAGSGRHLVDAGHRADHLLPSGLPLRVELLELLESSQVIGGNEGDERLSLLAKSLFSAVHGIVSLGQHRRFMAVPPAEIAAQITFIVEAFCDGVVARKG